MQINPSLSLISILILLFLNTVNAEIESIEDAEKLIKNYSHQISKNKNNAALYLARGDLYFKIRNFESAVEDYTQAINQDKNLDKDKVPDFSTMWKRLRRELARSRPSQSGGSH